MLSSPIADPPDRPVDTASAQPLQHIRYNQHNATMPASALAAAASIEALADCQRRLQKPSSQQRV